jgi:hypothetical protein
VVELAIVLPSPDSIILGINFETNVATEPIDHGVGSLAEQK